MGCWLSCEKETRKFKRTDATFESTYVAVTPPTRNLSKRLWTGHVNEDTSSGVSSAYSTPVRNTKTLKNRRTRRQLRTETPVKKAAQPEYELDLTYQNLPEFLKAVPLDIEGYESDLAEQRMERQKQILDLQAAFNDTAGYYSDDSSDSSSPLANGFVCTQSDDAESELDSSEELLNCNLDMEMQMMSKARGIMPKTSSPILQRRDATFEVRQSQEFAPMPPPSASYQKWRTYLQTTPTYALHNITGIPEAIAGLFCPPGFPAYTEIKAVPSKRHQENSYNEICRNFVSTNVPKEPPVSVQCTEL